MAQVKQKLFFLSVLLALGCGEKLRDHGTKRSQVPSIPNSSSSNSDNGAAVARTMASTMGAQ